MKNIAKKSLNFELSSIFCFLVKQVVDIADFRGECASEVVLLILVPVVQFEVGC